MTERQSPSTEAGFWFPPNHAWSANRWRGIASRIPFLAFRQANGALDVQNFSKDLLPKILQAAGQTDLPVRTTIYTQGATGVAIWVPSSDDVSGSGDVQFFYGGQTGLHINARLIDSVWLWRGRCLCCNEERWTIELGNERDEICLAVAAGYEGLEGNWRDLLTDICQ